MAFNFYTLALISNPLNNVFGWLTRLFYNFFGNYGLAIIALTVFIRVCMIPLNISSQRSMIKNKTMQTKQAEIQRKYPNDKQKQQEEMTKLMQENGATGFSGCLLSILQLFFIWPIFRIVSSPLKYLSGISVEALKKMGKIGLELKILEKNVVERIDVNDIKLLKGLTDNSEFLRKCIDDGFIKASQVLDLHFLGVDLSDVPEWNPVKIAADPKRCLPLLIFPVLVVLTSIITMQLGNVLNPDYKENKEKKKRAKKNAAMNGQAPTDQTEIMTKMMTFTMPALMVWTSFTMPAAMGLYWIVGSIMGIITQLIVYYLFTKPYALKKKELDAAKEAFLKSNKSGTNTNKENNDNSNSKKSKNSKKKK
ncbi:MAG: membrane protein insertase YidC [Clostridiales bacterium]|nr:membrane protein insertase YidC [Clostridiales bacterium]